AAGLARRPVALIVTVGSERAARAAKEATASIPIIATVAGDPVRRGLVASINRPGGNLTVVSLFTFTDNALIGKRVELLHEMAPQATTIGWLADSNILDFEDQLRDLRAAARALHLEVTVSRIAHEGELEAAFQTLLAQGARAALE